MAAGPLLSRRRTLPIESMFGARRRAVGWKISIAIRLLSQTTRERLTYQWTKEMCKQGQEDCSPWANIDCATLAPPFTTTEMLSCQAVAGEHLFPIAALSNLTEQANCHSPQLSSCFTSECWLLGQDGWSPCWAPQASPPAWGGPLHFWALYPYVGWPAPRPEAHRWWKAHAELAAETYSWSQDSQVPSSRTTTASGTFCQDEICCTCQPNSEKRHLLDCSGKAHRTCQPVTENSL